MGLVNDTQTSPVEGLRSFLFLADQNIVGVIGAASSSVSRFAKKNKGEVKRELTNLPFS